MLRQYHARRIQHELDDIATTLIEQSDGYDSAMDETTVAADMTRHTANPAAARRLLKAIGEEAETRALVQIQESGYRFGAHDVESVDRLIVLAASVAIEQALRERVHRRATPERIQRQATAAAAGAA